MPSYFVPVLEQLVVGYGTQVRMLEVVNVAGEALGDLLAYVIVDDGVTLARARRTQHEVARNGFTTFIQPSCHFFL